MNLIIKRLSDEVQTLKGTHLVYVQTEDGVNVKAFVCESNNLEEQINTAKSNFDIKQVIYFDL